MRLLNPTPGEVLDRISILSLKIRVSEQRGTDGSQFQAEKASLEDYLQSWDGMIAEDCGGDDELWTQKQNQLAEKKNGLQAVNSLLWDCEDKVRVTKDEELTTLAQLCRRIATLNDSRANLVREISELYGAKEVVPEKMYMEKKKVAGS